MKPEAIALPVTPSRAADFLSLSKPRLNLLVLATTFAGYYLAAGGASRPLLLFHTIVGTALVAAGASALNQVAERDVDGRMRRTRWRPLPDRRMQPAEATVFGVATAGAGLLQLAIGANLLAALIALATLVSYAAVYTPLKRRSSLSTIVGAVPGALPPMIGWAAVRGSIDIGPAVLFAIVFLWQIPHFLAIAWMYREDYERAGFPMLPVIDPGGGSTARQVTLYSLALIPVSLAPTLIGLAGTTYAVGALLLGLLFLCIALRFAAARTMASARQLFLASITYLPLLWILLLADAR